MKFKTTMTKHNEEQLFETINQLATTSAIAALTIAKHTNMNKTNAMLIGVGASLLVTVLVKYLEE